MSINKYYTLGSSGLKVSRLALGTMTFGSEWGWGAEKEGARKLFNRYVEAGGNFFDTADLYTNGTSETWLGEFIQEAGLRQKAVIASKFSYNSEPGNPNAGGNSRKHIRHALEASLKRLNTDYIDLYFLHTWDMLTRAEEVLRTLEALVQEGKILHIGLSDVPAWYAAKFQTLARERGLEALSSLQMEYSLVERGIENEFVPLSLEENIGMMIWSPLASGLLSGKYRPSESGVSGEGRLLQLNDSGNPAFAKFTERNWKIVEVLDQVSQAIEQPMAAVAINWVANRPGVSSVILGATKLSQLEQTLGSLDFEIPEEWQKALREASEIPKSFPYTFFTPGMQAMQTGGAFTASKPDSFHQETIIEASPVGVS